jgi:hypothetical protein
VSRRLDAGGGNAEYPRRGGVRHQPAAGIDLYEGNCRSYIEDLRKREGPGAERPHRVAV